MYLEQTVMQHFQTQALTWVGEQSVFWPAQYSTSQLLPLIGQSYFYITDHKLHWHPSPIPWRIEKTTLRHWLKVNQQELGVAREMLSFNGLPPSCLVPAGDVCSVSLCWWSPWFQLQKGQNFGDPESAATNLRFCWCWCWCSGVLCSQDETNRSTVCLPV